MFFEDTIDDDKYMGILFGLGQNLRKEKLKNNEKTDH